MFIAAEILHDMASNDAENLQGFKSNAAEILKGLTHNVAEILHALASTQCCRNSAGKIIPC